MPGPVSDAYDPEWGTAANAGEIAAALQEMHGRVSRILGNTQPLFILDLLRADLPRQIPHSLSEKQWRIIRFALERAKDSL